MLLLLSYYLHKKVNYSAANIIMGRGSIFENNVIYKSRAEENLHSKIFIKHFLPFFFQTFHLNSTRVTLFSFPVPAVRL